MTLTVFQRVTRFRTCLRTPSFTTVTRLHSLTLRRTFFMYGRDLTTYPYTGDSPLWHCFDPIFPAITRSIPLHACGDR